MKTFLVILGVVAFIGAAGFYSSSESAIHQILATTAATCGAVMIAGAGIIDAIEKIPENQMKYQAKVAEEMRKNAAAQQQQPFAQPIIRG